MSELRHAVFIVVAYAAAQFIVGWMTAVKVVESNLNGVNSYRRYLVLYAPAIALRMGLGLAVLSLYNDFRAPVCAFLGSITGLGWLKSFPVPVNPATSFLFGLGLEPLLHLAMAVAARKIPGLGKLDIEIPPIRPLAQIPKD